MWVWGRRCVDIITTAGQHSSHATTTNPLTQPTHSHTHHWGPSYLLIHSLIYSFTLSFAHVYTFARSLYIWLCIHSLICLHWILLDIHSSPQSFTYPFIHLLVERKEQEERRDFFYFLKTHANADMIVLLDMHWLGPIRWLGETLITLPSTPKPSNHLVYNSFLVKCKDIEFRVSVVRCKYGTDTKWPKASLSIYTVLKP